MFRVPLCPFRSARLYTTAEGFQHLKCWLVPASWSSGQGLWLLIMRSRVRFPGKIPVVTMVWVVSRFRLKAPPGFSSSCISPITSSGQRSRASWASQPQKSATLSPQSGGKPRKFIRTCGSMGGRGEIAFLTFFLKILGSQVKVPNASAGSWFQFLMVLFT